MASPSRSKPLYTKRKEPNEHLETETADLPLRFLLVPTGGIEPPLSRV